MGLLKTITRKPAVQRAIGRGIAAYLRLVCRTSRISLEPPDLYDRLTGESPFIGAMWHGQHAMMPLFRRSQDAACSMVSRSRDGEINAHVVQAFGIRPVRGSGARGRGQRGGAAALRELVRALDSGEHAFLTADVPKIARRCGDGIVTLARLSGRPIVPVAAVSSRHVAFRSWDRTTIPLPFGRIRFVAEPAIPVARDADPHACEAARIEVERGLNRAHARAYGSVGKRDPGADLPAAGHSGPAAFQ